MTSWLDLPVENSFFDKALGSLLKKLCAKKDFCSIICAKAERSNMVIYAAFCDGLDQASNILLKPTFTNDAMSHLVSHGLLEKLVSYLEQHVPVLHQSILSQSTFLTKLTLAFQPALSLAQSAHINSLHSILTSHIQALTKPELAISALTVLSREIARRSGNLLKESTVIVETREPPIPMMLGWKHDVIFHPSLRYFYSVKYKAHGSAGMDEGENSETCYYTFTRLPTSKKMILNESSFVTELTRPERLLIPLSTFFLAKRLLTLKVHTSTINQIDQRTGKQLCYFRLKTNSWQVVEDFIPVKYSPQQFYVVHLHYQSWQHENILQMINLRQKRILLACPYNSDLQNYDYFYTSIGPLQICQLDGHTVQLYSLIHKVPRIVHTPEIVVKVDARASFLCLIALTSFKVYSLQPSSVIPLHSFSCLPDHPYFYSSFLTKDSIILAPVHSYPCTLTLLSLSPPSLQSLHFHPCPPPPTHPGLSTLHIYAPSILSRQPIVYPNNTILYSIRLNRQILPYTSTDNITLIRLFNLPCSDGDGNGGGKYLRKRSSLPPLN